VRTVYSADWVLPIADRPIDRGWVAVDEGRISGVGSGHRPDAVELGRVAVLPALVNAHTHLELSFLRGAVPPAGRFVDWVRTLLAARRQHPDTQAPAILDAAARGIEEARATGTGLLADVGNTLATVPLLREAGMPARVFYELLGFNALDPGGRLRAAREQVARTEDGNPLLRISLAPHAPYSVSPGLFSAIRADLDLHTTDVSSVHLAESPEEVELLQRGTGGWRDLLGELGVWTDAWRVPAVSPVAYLAGLGFLDHRTLAVHLVQSSAEDLSLIRRLGTTVVSCPRSNRHVGVGDPPLEAFYASGVPVALGTDSLASVTDLNLFSELAAARRLASRVPAHALLASATLVGARALGFDDDYGSLEVGKRAAIIAVQVPEPVVDVEEYLVSGIDADRIRWVAPSHPRGPEPSHRRP
jgi:cytosine/adenosine deaminase-related metal-dependent hydrolase